MSFKKKYILCAFGLIFISTSTVAQKFVPFLHEPELGYPLTLQRTLHSYFLKDHYQEFMKKCEVGNALISFTINSKKEVSDVIFTEGVPKYLKDFLIYALQTTNGHWSTKSFKDQTFILPVVWRFVACREQPVINNTLERYELGLFPIKEYQNCLLLSPLVLKQWAEY